MKNYIIVLLGLFIVVATVPSIAYAELYENTINRPASSGEFEDDYEADDTDQIKDSVSMSWFSKRRYNVYQPNGSTERAPYKRAAIILFHGAARPGSSLVERWRDIADTENVILIGPYALKSNKGRWSLEEDALNFVPKLLDDAIEKYNIDEGRLYMFGHSNGGSFVLSLASMYSDRFAAAGLHAGKFYKRQYMDVVKTAKRKIPIVFVNGTHDRNFPLDEVREAADVYADNDHQVELNILQNHGHWYYDIAPSINEIVWEFMRYKFL